MVWSKVIAAIMKPAIVEGIFAAQLIVVICNHYSSISELFLNLDMPIAAITMQLQIYFK